MHFLRRASADVWQGLQVQEPEKHCGRAEAHQKEFSEIKDILQNHIVKMDV